jgi:hypothetical protein
MKNNFSFVHTKSWPYIGYALAVTFVLWIIGLEFLGFLALACALVYAYVFRQPNIFFDYSKAKGLLAPLEGEVVAITELQDNQEYGYSVTIEGSFQTESILRVPMKNATVMSVTLQRGTRLAEISPLFPYLNEQGSVVFQDNEGHTILVEHLLKKSIIPLFLEVQEGFKVEQNSVYGVGANTKTTLYLPHNFHFDVKVGSTLYCGQTLIGHFA